MSEKVKIVRKEYNRIILAVGDEFIITDTPRLNRYLKEGKSLEEYAEKEMAWSGVLKFSSEEEVDSYLNSLKIGDFRIVLPEKRIKTSKKLPQKYIPLDRTISYLGYEIAVNPDKIEVLGPWNSDSQMVLYYAFLKLLEASKNTTPDQKKLYESKDKIKKYCEDMEFYKVAKPEVFKSLAVTCPVDPSDLRKLFNVKDRYTNKQICKIALTIPGIYFKGKGRIYRDKKSGHYRNVIFSCGLGNVLAVDTGRKEPHTGETKYKLIFRFYTELSMMIVANLFNARPIKVLNTFYRLLPARRNIYSSIMLKGSNPCYFREQELLDLAGIKDTNPRRARKSLANHLDKLQKDGLIEKWKSSKTKKSYSYGIWR